MKTAVLYKIDRHLLFHNLFLEVRQNNNISNFFQINNAK
jgi:hypothetical protein